MEGELIFLENGRHLIFVENGRRHPFFCQWKTASIFLSRRELYESCIFLNLVQNVLIFQINVQGPRSRYPDLLELCMCIQKLEMFKI